MAQVIVEFDTTVTWTDGTRWVPRVCGKIGDDNLWHGWIEFTPASGSAEPVRTPRETVQPNRDDLMYWAQGLTQIYLEDALVRALEPSFPRGVARSVSLAPHFDSPAPRSPRHAPATGRRAVLNPLDVYQQGEDVLLSTLSALDTPRLRDIAVLYGFASAGAADGKNHEQLTATIMAGVRRPLVERESNRSDSAP
jgi:hypothetical protein